MSKRGRPFGTKKEPRVSYHRRVLPEWVEIMDNKLKELKEKHQDYKKSIYK